jgi:D-3-phosphoglycerate dehydrogenase / 2-oxoglutarate reductase
MSETVDVLILDLLEWIGSTPRPYSEVLDAWRTSCPRLPVWEDACDRGFIERRYETGGPCVVVVSAAGREHLQQHRSGATIGRACHRTARIA